MKKVIAVLLATLFAGASLSAIAADKPTPEQCKKDPTMAGCPKKKVRLAKQKGSRMAAFFWCSLLGSRSAGRLKGEEQEGTRKFFPFITAARISHCSVA